MGILVPRNYLLFGGRYKYESAPQALTGVYKKRNFVYFRQIGESHYGKIQNNELACGNAPNGQRRQGDKEK